MNNWITMSLLVALQIITCFFLLTATASPPDGFSVDLLHRRYNSSSLSPLSDGSSPYADIISNTYGYLMKLQIGTPPLEIEASLDTGSHLIWTQCLPCLNCYDQGTIPKFDPSKSSTYKAKTCDTSRDKSCPYEVYYGDKSYSKGTYATETVTIQSTSGQPFVMLETTIGCGHNNSLLAGRFTSVAGIVGLNRGPSSLISQMEAYNIQGLFSYCLSGKKGTSKINFGSNAIVAGDGTVAANMFRKTEQPDLYYLNLDVVSVGEKSVETLGTPFYAVDGNIILDSGTTYTYLPVTYCNQVMEVVDKVVKADRVDFSDDMLCYNSDTIEIFPEIKMHFAGGADLVLDKNSIYEDYGGTFCLTIICSNTFTIFGNLAQNNLLVGYDTSSELVSFKPTNCSALWS